MFENDWDNADELHNFWIFEHLNASDQHQTRHTPQIERRVEFSDVMS